MDDIRKLPVDINFLDPPKYFINLNLAEIPDQMNDTNDFLYHVLSELFGIIRPSIGAVVFNIPDTYTTKNITYKLLNAINMTHVPHGCTRLTRSHPGMYPLILFKFNAPVDVIEVLTLFNVIR